MCEDFGEANGLQAIGMLRIENLGAMWSALHSSNALPIIFDIADVRMAIYGYMWDDGTLAFDLMSPLTPASESSLSDHLPLRRP